MDQRSRPTENIDPRPVTGDRQATATETLTLETVPCLLCGSDKKEPRYSLEDYYTRQPGRFYLVQCQHCGLVYLNPRPTPDAIQHYYPPTYQAYTPVRVENLPWLKRHLIEYGLWKRCQPLLKQQSAGRVLDIGCGRGYFLAAMQKYGRWQTVGIDLSPEAVAFATNDLKVEAYAGRLEEMNFPDHSFDAVTLWDALEHLPHPRQTLLEVQRILKPTGRLLLRVPWLDSLDARLFGSYWAGLDTPRHLTVFSRDTLTRLLRETGFGVERLWCMSGSHASFVISLRFVLSQPNHGRWPKLLHRVLTHPIGHLLSAPYFFIIDKLRLGSEITVLASKRG